MRDVVQVIVVSLVGLWLAGCSTTTTTVVDDQNKPAQEQVVVEETVETTVAPTPSLMPPPGSQAGLLGSNTQDDLSLGKKYYRTGNYGLAEKYFRRAVETHATDAEAWLGLAAAYDQLRRFDLADRAYGNAIRIAGPTVEVINNQGYSLMLRGKYRDAAAKFAQAATKAPENQYVKNNIRLLAEATHQRKSIE